MYYRVSRRTFLAAAGGSVASTFMAGGTARAREGQVGTRPPNLIVIMADDLGAKELSCYGNRVHQTPHLDGLGRRRRQIRDLLRDPHLPPNTADDDDRAVWLP